MGVVTFREAIRQALAEELERDPSVVLLGEDIRPGGVFNVTPGLAERFGDERVIDTPISELGFAAAAFGAAVCGLRPVVEIMFGDFLALTLDVLVNQAAKYWYVSNEQRSVPLVVRVAVGATGRLGPLHSQTPTGFVLGVPGLTVLAPATPADAKGLTKAAVRDGNPVVVFEHKALYGSRGEVPEGEDGTVPIGRGRLVRSGADCTIVAAMDAVRVGEQAADALAGEGIAAELIDLRSLRPLDVELVAESVARTGALVVVEEGPPVGGYAAELLAGIAERLPGTPMRRVTMPDVPVPFSPPLEDAVLLTPARVAGAVAELLAHAPVRGSAA